jgi:hypothetical protein
MSSRHSFTDGVIAFVTAHEGQWLDAIRFEQFGRQAWRTRISDARKRLEAAREGTIENRVLRGKDHRSAVRSQYRFVRSKPVTLFDQMEQPSV